MECLFIFISSERQNNLIYEELIKAADQLKLANQKKPRPILKSLSLKPTDGVEELFCDSEIYDCNHDWQGHIPNIGCEFQQISEDFCHTDYFRLAEHLHKICDEEITIGRTNIQLIWCVDKYAPCPSEVPEFYGAVERMKLWHNCSFSVVTKNKSNVVEWSSVFSFQVAKSCEEIVTSAIHTLWTGKLGLRLESRNSLTEIGDVCLQLNNFSASSSKFKHLSESYILPVAEMYEDVHISSIPWPSIVAGSICQLNMLHSNEPNEKDDLTNLFSRIINSKGVGALLRIRYSEQPPSLIHPTAVQTSNWKQTITDGQFTTIPSLQFKGYHQCQVFLLTSEGSTEQNMYAIALQDLNSCGEDVMKLALSETSTQLECDMNVEYRQSNEKHIYDLLKETPQLTPVHMAAMSHLLVQLPVNLRKCLEKNGQNVNNLWTETKEELEYLTNCEIFNHLFMTRPPRCIVGSPNTVFEPEINAPKESWPEYRALMELKPPDLNTSGSSLSALRAMSVIPEGAPVCFKAEQLLHFFSMDGKPSDTVNQKLVKFSPKGKNRFTRSFQQFNVIQKTNWPDSLLSSYHGIDYNTGNEQETFDSSCCKLKDQWIVEETNSTCSTFQKDSISGWKKNISIKKPRSNDQNSSRSGSSYRTPSQYSLTQERRLLRRSPRKKVKKDTERSLLKASDLLRMEASSSERSKRTRTIAPKVTSSELSEFHTRKLRNAVLFALESQKVSVSSATFKSCFRKLFAVCLPFVSDVIGLGSTTRSMEKIAKAHVKQVIEFERLKKL